ncbi:MAG: hypothetical protein ACXVZT_06615, partial [Terriglobales bacterium]
AAIGKLNADLSACEEPDMSVSAGFGSDKRLDIARPVEPWRVNRSFDPGISGSHDVEVHSTEFAVLGAWNPGHQGIGCCHERVSE